VWDNLLPIISSIIALFLFILVSGSVAHGEEVPEKDKYTKIIINVERGYEYSSQAPVTSFVDLDQGLYFPTSFTSLEDVKIDKVTLEDGSVVYTIYRNRD
jgi:hypothetical protein